MGDSFFNISLSEAQELIAAETTEIEEQVGKLEDEKDSIKEQVDELKAHLYARFGRGINLES